MFVTIHCQVHFSVLDKRFPINISVVEQLKRLLQKRAEELGVKKLVNSGLKQVVYPSYPTETRCVLSSLIV